MNKFFLVLVAFTMAVSASAQYRKVKLPDAPKQTDYKNFETENTGFWWSADAEIGTSIMENKPNMQYSNVTWTGGYRLNEFLRLGAGIGVRYYMKNADVRDSNNKLGFPIFANARGNFISAYDRDGVPFWSVNIGGITNDGFFLSPTIGYSFGGIRNNFQIGVSYTLSSFKNSNKNNVAYSFLGVKLGYEF